MLRAAPALLVLQPVDGHTRAAITHAPVEAVFAGRPATRVRAR